MNEIVIVDSLGNIEPIDYFTFPGGEVQVKLPEGFSKRPNQTYRIAAHIRNSDGVMAVVLVNDAIKRHAAESKVSLGLLYTPYARQDRVCSEGEANGIAAFAQVINSCNFDSVALSDPHSDVAAAVINNSFIITQEETFRCEFPTMKKYHDATLVAPDAGAAKKVGDLAGMFNYRPIIQASKVRDTKTGNITGTEVYGSVAGKDLLIVDDICDGGRTFIELSKVLKQNGANNVGLYVTHGIFSKGKDVLLEYIDDIYCCYDWTEGKN